MRLTSHEHKPTKAREGPTVNELICLSRCQFRWSNESKGSEMAPNF